MFISRLKLLIRPLYITIDFNEFRVRQSSRSILIVPTRRGTVRYYVYSTLSSGCVSGCFDQTIIENQIVKCVSSCIVTCKKIFNRTSGTPVIKITPILKIIYLPFYQFTISFKKLNIF